MIKLWGTYGLHLWERKYAVVFPQLNQGTFVLGGLGPAGDHAALSSPIGSGYVVTTLASAAANGATTLSVTSVNSGLNTAGAGVTAISNAYNIGIQLDGGTVQWTTVSGAPSGTTVTLAAGLTGGASAGNYVYCYQTKLFKPMRIKDGFLRQKPDQTVNYNDVPVKIISREEYNRFGGKGAPGTPVQLFYDPQATSGNLYLYPTFVTCNMVLFIEFEKPIEDITNSGDNFDIPPEWMMALRTNLAYWIAPEYEVPKEKYDMIKEQAAGSLNLVLGWDQEDASILFQPQNWMYGSEYKG
jgi:hypothetical protein